MFGLPLKKSAVFADQSSLEELRIIKSMIEQLMVRLDVADARLSAIEKRIVKKDGDTEVANPKSGPKTKVVR